MIHLKKNELFFLAFLLGFSSILTQLEYIKEFLAILSGNELVIGILLSNWMILTGLGAYSHKTLIRINHSSVYLLLWLLLMLLPPASVYLMYYLKGLLFPVGSIISITQIYLFSLLVMLPFCFVSGILFASLTGWLNTSFGNESAARVYGIETIGCIASSLFFSFVAILYLTSYQAFAILLIFFSISIIKIEIGLQKRIKLIVSLLLLGVGYIFFLLPVDKHVKSLVFKNQQVVQINDSPSGSLVVTKMGEQFNYYLNSSIVANSNNLIADEEAIHFAMALHPNPQKVLCLGEGTPGIFQEIDKHNLPGVVYIDNNQQVINILDSTISKKNTKLLKKDARKYIRNTTTKFDIILLNKRHSGSFASNRYYTLEFFKEAKQILATKGIVRIYLPNAHNYVSKEASTVLSVIYNTAISVFNHALLIPGESNSLLLSDNLLSHNYLHKIEQKKINTEYVNSYYLDSAYLSNRSMYLTTSIQQDTKLNTDFRPIAYFNAIVHELSFFKTNAIWIFGTIVLLIAALFLRLNPVALGMFSTGFMASSVELLLLMFYQIVYGYIHTATGITFALFMAGTAMGALIKLPIQLKNLVSLHVLSVGWIALTGISMYLLSNTSNQFVLHFCIYMLILITGIITGHVFKTTSKLYYDQHSHLTGNIYAVDLVGSAFGALIIPTVILPLFGFYYALMIVALICTLSLLKTVFSLVRVS
ncbi:MAG: hypothetical protein MI922_11200 [Bacteroidales bacterium]|nr:hypothetical protein [Bacteroidales bacterium]